MHPEPVDLNLAVDDVLKLLRRVMGELVHIEFLPGENLAAAQADRGMVEQALMNLCLNGRDAMPDGGALTIKSGAVTFSESDCASRSWARPGHYVFLSVQDGGTGMTPETMEHMFEPFFSTKDEYKGTGLGLATVYGIMRQHEGLINVESQPGRGTIFWLYWPAASTLAARRDAQQEQAPPGGDETILVAEDDSMVRELVYNLLKRAGYTVVIAKNGKEAVERFEAYPGQVDLAVLDLVMPEMGGWEAFERMRALQPELKAVFASGYSEENIDRNLLGDREFILLHKPFTMVPLLRTVREVLDNHHGS